MAVATTISAQFKAIDKMTAPIKRMERSMGMFSSKSVAHLTRVEMKLNTIRKRINNTVGKLGRLGGVGAAGALFVIGKATVELDKNIKSLSAITGATGAQLAGFTTEIDKVAKSQRQFTGDVAKAFEVVGSAQPELLKNSKALGAVTDAAITLSKAGLMEVEDSAKALTGTLNQFGLGSEHSQRVINVLAAGAKEGSANIQLLSESMDRVGAVAASANMSVEQTAAAVELMSKFNLKGSEAGISLKSTLLRLKAASLGFASGQFNLNDALVEYNEKIAKIKDPIKRAAFEEKTFGKVHILTGKILTENIDQLNGLTKAMTGSNEATVQATTNGESLAMIGKEIVDMFKNSVTSTDQNNKSLDKLKDRLRFVRDNMGKIIKVIGFLIGAYFALIVIQKLYMAMLALNKFMRFIKVIYMMAKAKGVATTAQWALNKASAAFPVFAIIIGIMALVAVIIWMVKNWDKVIEVYEKIRSNKFLSFILWQYILIIEVIKRVVESVKKVIKAFKSGGALNAIKMIGLQILKYINIPLRLVFTMLAKIPKIGKPFAAALNGFDSMIDNMESGLTADITKDVKVENSPMIQPASNKKDLNSVLDLNIQNTSDKQVTPFLFGGSMQLQQTGS